METKTIATIFIAGLSDFTLIALNIMAGIPPIIIKMMKKKVAKKVLTPLLNSGSCLHSVNNNRVNTNTTICNK